MALFYSGIYVILLAEAFQCERAGNAARNSLDVEMACVFFQIILNGSSWSIIERQEACYSPLPFPLQRLKQL